MRHVQVGSVDVYALVDNVQGYPSAGVYPGGDEVVARYKHYLDSEGKVALNFGCFLLRDGASLVLVDAGWGPERDGRLMQEIAATGMTPADITAVIFTHLHGDHTGWNFDRATSKPMFPNARYLVPQRDWDHYEAQTPPADASGNRPWQGSFGRDVVPLRDFGCMDLIEGERELSPALTALPTPGHTPGHTSVAIVSGSERGFILGDVTISPIDVEEPELKNSFDWNADIALETRRTVLDRLSSDGSLVGASHLPAPGLGHFVRAESRTTWRALK